jgi:hypothetical protein
MPRFDPWPGEFPIQQWDPKFRQRVSPNGETYGNIQEEPVRQWAAVQLVKNFGVPHRQIKFEEPVKFQEKRKSARQRAKGFRDIVVCDDRYNHELFYIEFDDLYRLIDDANTVFDPVFRHRDRINLGDEITKLNELRNRVMHGRYLTDENEQAIRLACHMFDRILQRYIRVLEPRRLGGR